MPVEVPIVPSFANCILVFVSVFATISETVICKICKSVLFFSQRRKTITNSLIWTFAPKHLHSSPKIVEIATYLCVIIFNEGFVGVLKVMTAIGCPVDREMYACVQKRDGTRSSRNERHTSDTVEQERIGTKAKQSTLKEF
ncbi:uncharacterized protein TNCV_5053371 [Trichonephila clavipes]|nr:uncharacterized protein TNCV_5053371 [Trichonephila clavipes]